MIRAGPESVNSYFIHLFSAEKKCFVAPDIRGLLWLCNGGWFKVSTEEQGTLEADHVTCLWVQYQGKTC